MEPLPKKPILVPQSRRFTRTFKVDGGLTYQPHDTITINIPPMNRSYLSKDSRIFFQTELDYATATTLNYNSICTQLYNLGFLNGYRDVNNINMGYTPFEAGIQNVIDFFQLEGYRPTGEFAGANELKKSLPTLTTAGPYAFFSELQVYDYLGNTLLETIKGHDLWASFMSDFQGFDPNLEALRPPISVRNANGSFYESKYPCINYLDTSNHNKNYETLMESPPLCTINLPTTEEEAEGNWNWCTSIVTENGVDRNWSIELLGFLGKGSNKFVPLHNGFTIKLVVNSKHIPIVMANGLGQDRIWIQNNGNTAVPYPIASAYWLINGQINNLTVSNIYLRSEILEITAELDNQVDKTLFCKMRDYIQTPSLSTENKLPFYKKSLTKLIAFERFIEKSNVVFFPEVGDRYLMDSHDKLGYRVNNFVKNAKLRYNSSTLVEYTNINEFLSSLFTYVSPTFYKCFTDSSFYSNITQILENQGTLGYQTMFYSDEEMVNRYLRSGTVYPYNSNNITTQNLIPRLGNTHMGKFAMVFDLELPGFSQKNVCGIDTTKSYITLQLDREDTNTTFQVFKYFVNTDIFAEFDAFIHVDPGKQTSVSF